MRGNQGAGVIAPNLGGSIPAHAGEPRCPGARPWLARVYPRACGGTSAVIYKDDGFTGLSPRMRGNPVRSCCPSLQGGSIPAHAGEPAACSGLRGYIVVYPRACGGTEMECRDATCCLGLSPRMRGNRWPPSRTPPPAGSIPAHAGEPPLSQSSSRRSRVYPRACGGTAAGTGMTLRDWGLSPRMRGNLEGWASASSRAGSIPAHAGEPPPAWRKPSTPRVYPRACGGTVDSVRPWEKASGLSPRMRGNHRQHRDDTRGPGSIPAHAGEP